MKKILTFAVVVLLAIGLTMSPAHAFLDDNDVNDNDTTSEAQVTQNYDDHSVTKSRTSRGLPGGVYQPPQVNPQYHNARETRTWNILQFAELAKIRRTWTREQLEVVIDSADGDDGEVTSIPYNAVPSVTAKADRSPFDKISMVFSTKVPEGHFDKGIIQSRGEADTNGLIMAAQSLLDGMNMGGKYLMIVVDAVEIQQYTKARTFFIGGGMSAITGDSGSSAGGGGAASGIGAGTITSGKGLAPHATCVVLAEAGTPMMLKDGKAVPQDVSTLGRGSLVSDQDLDAADLDEEGLGSKRFKPGKSSNGGQMKKFYNQTDQK